MPSNRSRQSATRVVTSTMLGVSTAKYQRRCLPFHSNPSCKRKNSWKAGSADSSPNFFGVSCCSLKLTADWLRRWPGVAGFDLLPPRQICISMPSIWRRPLRILSVSFDAMLSKDKESSVSILKGAIALSQSGSEYPADRPCI